VHCAAPAQGAGGGKPVTPRVGGSEAKKGPRRSDLFFRNLFYGAFETPKAQKLDKNRFSVFFGRFFVVKLFDTIFL
jgi:hypothetical protein